MYSADPTEYFPLLSQATRVRCLLKSCDRSRHFSNGTKIQYECRFQVVDGPHAGCILVRSLWDSEGGRGVLQEDCGKLDIVHPEELCAAGRPPVIVEGTASAKGSPYGTRNELQWIDRRVTPKLVAPLPPLADTSSPDPF